ncbi:hypothetical protein EVAR_75463_1 [Eumeta japonica]|uniref:Uncharacterized protein n=1 Tax=Eumeta variegata TaxID=151549 RepID=A0A4C1TK54_EUMVA|nr:hypothetical protein EVAR_75463_1 [Eumeta japonica]
MSGVSLKVFESNSSSNFTTSDEPIAFGSLPTAKRFIIIHSRTDSFPREHSPPLGSSRPPRPPPAYRTTRCAALPLPPVDFPQRCGAVVSVRVAVG